jgi:hypothetical protein
VNGENDVDTTTSDVSLTQHSSPERDDLVALANRAQQGDQTAVPALRELLKDPAIVDLLGGDLAQQVQMTLVAKLCGCNHMLKDALTRKLELLRAELAGPSQNPLERLLVERIAACWLHLHYLEAAYANKDGITPQLGTYYQRNLTSAQKRYLAAIKALALVRKLSATALQVNVARQQVNVVGP